MSDAKFTGALFEMVLLRQDLVGMQAEVCAQARKKGELQDRAEELGAKGLLPPESRGPGLANAAEGND